jgi:superfamily II DNA or RNA helicase
VNAEIHIHGCTSFLRGEDLPWKELRLATSWLVDGHEYASSYQKGVWDGRKNLMNLRNGSFPTGLLNIVLETLKGNGVQGDLVEHRMDPLSGSRTDTDFEVHGAAMTGKYAWQLDVVKTMVARKQGVVRVATNGGKTTLSASVTKYLNLKTLFTVTSVELLYQVQKMFAKRLDIPLEDVGIIGDGHWSPKSWVTVAIVDTLEARLDTQDCIDFLESIEVLFIDEAHHTGSDTWYSVVSLCPAFYRFGLSGTPLDRTDGANLRLLAATGDIIVDIGNKFLVELGVSAKAHIVFDKITGPVLPRKTKYPSAYKQGVTDNEQLNEKVLAWTTAGVDAGLSVLILVSEIAHGKFLDEQLWTNVDGKFIPHQFIWGDESSEVRSTALTEFGERRLPVLLASTILNEGVDVPTIDMIICAGAKKSKIQTLQRLGRGLRGDKLIVVEFSNFCHDYLLRHSMQRLQDYKNEECFPIYQCTEPSSAFVQKLWDTPR